MKKLRIIDQSAVLMYLCAIIYPIFTPPMANKKVANLSFEQAAQELEAIVQKLEGGELNLEESMTLFERGLELSKHSQAKLSDAEQKIRILQQQNGQENLVDFELSQPQQEPNELG